MLECETNFRVLYSELQDEMKETPNSIKFILDKDDRGYTCNFHSFKSTIPDGSRKDESCYGLMERDAYGKPLTYLSVEVLLKYKRYPQVLTSKKHKAIWAYLEQLDPKTKVVLYWH